LRQGAPPLPVGQGGILASLATGHWQLVVKHRLGSLDALTTRVRRRNLAASIGILLVLLASVVMIIIASERARSLARLQMEFAAGVSHELRSPLGVIQALAYNLAAGIVKDPAHIRQYAKMVQYEAYGLSNMVEQILLFAETRSNFKNYEVGAMDAIDAIDHALAAIDNQIQEHGAEIVTSIPDDLPMICANETPLVTCVQNLISNALKYGRPAEGPNTIQIVAEHAPDSPEVRISVIDGGHGIPPEDLAHLFEPFYRGRSVNPGIRGAGLGLYLVKRLMEAQGGSVTVESKPNEGSAFRLHIPIAGAAQGRPIHGQPAVSG
jgi:signal transduction histidine kinase